MEAAALRAEGVHCDLCAGQHDVHRGAGVTWEARWVAAGLDCGLNHSRQLCLGQAVAYGRAHIRGASHRDVARHKGSGIPVASVDPKVGTAAQVGHKVLDQALLGSRPLGTVVDDVDTHLCIQVGVKRRSSNCLVEQLGLSHPPPVSGTMVRNAAQGPVMGLECWARSSCNNC